jgi:hypothetical protein
MYYAAFATDFSKRGVVLLKKNSLNSDFNFAKRRKYGFSGNKIFEVGKRGVKMDF